MELFEPLSVKGALSDLDLSVENLPAGTRYRLVGVGLSGFERDDREAAGLRPGGPLLDRRPSVHRGQELPAAAGHVRRLLADEDPDPESRAEFVHTMREQVARLTKLTTDLGAVLSDVRRDPRRYTKGMICVLNCK